MVCINLPSSNIANALVLARDVALFSAVSSMWEMTLQSPRL